jgi:hypothetical protein
MIWASWERHPSSPAFFFGQALVAEDLAIVLWREKYTLNQTYGKLGKMMSDKSVTLIQRKNRINSLKCQWRPLALSSASPMQWTRISSKGSYG